MAIRKTTLKQPAKETSAPKLFPVQPLESLMSSEEDAGFDEEPSEEDEFSGTEEDFPTGDDSTEQAATLPRMEDIEPLSPDVVKSFQLPKVKAAAAPKETPVQVNISGVQVTFDEPHKTLSGLRDKSQRLETFIKLMQR